MTSAVGTLSRGEQLTMDRGVVTMSADVREELPIAEENGDEAVWIITDRDGVRHEINGMFLGMGSTHRPYHKGHPDTAWAPRGVHCSTCRWTELRIFRGLDRRLFVIRCGASDVPGERDLVTVAEVEAPFELVESLAVLDRDSRMPSLPMPARRALSQAASHDAGIRDAYINSPVT
jgi:hypothetical protein